MNPEAETSKLNPILHLQWQGRRTYRALLCLGFRVQRSGFRVQGSFVQRESISVVMGSPTTPSKLPEGRPLTCRLKSSVYQEVSNARVRHCRICEA